MLPWSPRRAIRAAAVCLLWIALVADASIAVGGDVPRYAWTIDHAAVDPFRHGRHTAAADVTGDGRADLLLTTASASEWTLWVAVQASDGSLGSFTPFPLSSGSQATNDLFIATGDVDRDGDVDVAVSSLNGVHLLRQDGGTLVGDELVPQSAGGGRLWLGDADGDDDADLITLAGGASSVGQVAILRQGDAGAWTEEVIDEGFYFGLAVVDLDGNGRPDVVTSAQRDLVVFRQRADATFRKRAFEQVWSVSGIGSLDVTRDRLPDVVFTVNEKLLMLPGVAGGWPGPQQRLGAARGEDIGVSDLDGNGKPDVTVTSTGNNDVSIFERTRDGGLTAICRILVPATSDFTDVTVADVSGDGIPEIAMGADGSGQSVHVLRQTRDAPVSWIATGFTTPTPFTSPVEFSVDLQPSGTCPSTSAAGLDVAVYRSIGGSDPVLIDRTTTTRNGVFRVSDQPGVLGDVSYTARWGGDDFHQPSQQTWQTTVVPASVLRLETRSTSPAGRPLPFTVRLLAHEITSDPEVSVFASAPGGPETLVLQGDVDPTTGTLTGQLPTLDGHTILRATWGGDSDFDPEERSQLVEARVHATGKLLRYRSKSGVYHIYPAGRDVFYRCTVEPNQAGTEAGVVVARSRISSGIWRGWADGEFQLDEQSRITVYVPGEALRDTFLYRVSCSHGGTDQLQGHVSRVAYFRIR